VQALQAETKYAQLLIVEVSNLISEKRRRHVARERRTGFLSKTNFESQQEKEIAEEREIAPLRTGLSREAQRPPRSKR